MSRRGRFGHRPTSGGNLTALIASLYQQQRQAEDRVMFDAYQNGGNGLDGKPVTDKKMRDYIAMRRNGFSKDDPLHAEWNNRLIQLDFKIGEEKIGLAYKQGKVGAGAVAAYYRQQLRHIPQDSEFYRDVAGRAADWAKAAAGAAHGAARGRLTHVVEGKQAGVQKTWDNYSALVGYLTTAARRAGLISGNQQLTDADATDLEAFLKTGVAGPHGTTITFADWQHATVAAYKAFGVAISLNKQLNRGTKELSQAKSRFLTDNVVKVNTVDDRAKYELARDAFEQAVKDANGDPRAVLAAAQLYATQLSTIKAVALKGQGLSGENEADFIGGLTNEIEALTTGKSNGLSVADLYSNGSNQDIKETSASITQAQNDVKALADGSAFYGQSEYGGKFSVIYAPPGAKLDPFGKGGLDESFQKAIISIDGKPTEVLLKGKPVIAKGLVDPSGQPVKTVDINGKQVKIEDLTRDQISQFLANGYKSTDGKTVGYVFTQNGKTSYGVIQSDGSLKYTTANPFGSNQLPGGDAVGVFVGSGAPKGSTTVQATPPVYSNASATSLITDESVSVKDLLTLAETKNSTEKAALVALAEKKQKDITAEYDYEHHKETGGTPVNGFLSGVSDALKNVSDAILEATNTAPKLTSSAPPALPSISTYGPPTTPTVHTTAPAPPTTSNTPPSTTNTQKDDKYTPPPPANTEGAKASGGTDDTYKPPTAPEPTGASGGGTQAPKAS